MKPKILFVDDEQNILDSLRLSMRSMRAKWDMSFALGGKAALELLAREPHDVVVSDMRMPGLDGAEFLREVRARHPQSVRIILSGYAEEESILKTVTLAHQYLSKPCRPVDLVAAVEKALSLRGVLDHGPLKTLVARMEGLPTLPEVYKRLSAALQEEHATLKELGDIVCEDVAMSASILRLVNSAFFGLPRHISSVHHAVNLIGGQTLRVLVLSAHLFTVLEPAAMPSFSVKLLWEHSQRVACFAKAIAMAEGACRDDRDNGFIAGMLHDMGKLILATNLPAAYQEIIDRVRLEAIPLHVAELEGFGATHAQVGAYLMGLWGFDQPVMEAVCWHHCLDKQTSDLFSPALAVHVADLLDHELVRIHAGYVAWPLQVGGTQEACFQERLRVWRGCCADTLTRARDDV